MLNLKLRRIIFICLLVLLLTGALVMAVNTALNHPPVQRYLLAQIADQIGYEIQAGQIRVNFWRAVGISAREAVIVSRHSGQILHASAINVSFDVPALLRGRLDPVRVYVIQPEFDLFQPRQRVAEKQVTSIPWQAIPFSKVDGLESVVFKDARIFVEGWPYRLRKVNLELFPRPDDKGVLDIHLSGQIYHRALRAGFNLQGVIDPRQKSPDDTAMDLTLTVKELPLDWIPLPNQISVSGGEAGISVRLQAKWSEALSAKGKIEARNLSFSISERKRQKAYQLPRLQADFTLGFENRVLTVTSAEIRGSDFKLGLTSAVDFNNRADPYLSLRVASEPMALERFKSLFPTSLLAGWIEAGLFPVFSGGRARLESFELNGSLNQIRFLGRIENASVLGLHLVLTDMRALVDTGGIPVDGVNGRLDIADGRLSASGVSGRFADSVIHAAALDVPSLYKKPGFFLISAKGEFALNDLRHQSKIKLLPRTASQSLAPFTSFEGRVKSRFNMRFESPGWQPRFFDSEFEFSDCHLERKDWVFPLSLPSATMRLDARGIPQFSGHGSWGSTQFQMAGAWDAPLVPYVSRRLTDVEGTLSLSADLKDLAVLKKTSLLPAPLLGTIAPFETVEGRLLADLRVRPLAGAPFFDVLSGQVELNNCQLSGKQILLPLRLNRAGLTLSADRSGRFTADGKWGASQFSIQGDIDKARQAITTRISSRMIPGELLARLFPDRRFAVDFNQPSSLEMTLSKTRDRWSCRGLMSLTGAAVKTAALSMTLDGPSDNLVFDIQGNDEGIVDFKRLGLNLGESLAEISGSYDGSVNKEIILDINADTLGLADLNLRATALAEPPAGRLQIRSHAEISLTDPVQTRIKGRVTGFDLSVALKSIAVPVRIQKVDMTLEDERVDIQADGLDLGGSQGQARARLTGYNGLRGDIALSLDTLDLSHFVEQLKTPAGSGVTKPNRFVEQTDLAITLSAGQVDWQKAPLGAMEAGLQYQGGNFKIDQARFDMPHGELKVKGHVKTHPQSNLFFLFLVKIENQPVEPLTRFLGPYQNRLQGLLSLEGALFMEGRKNSELLSSMTGGLNISLAKGQILKSHVMLSILEFLSLEKLFVKKPPDLSQEGFYFEHVQGYVAINKGVCETEGLVIKSPILNALIRGSADLAAGQITADLAVQPLGTVDWLVSQIPIIGHILTGEDKTILVYYFKAEGPLAAPEVNYVPFKNLGKSTMGYITRLFMTPDRLFKKMSAIFDDMAANRQDLSPDSLATDWVREEN